MNETAKIALYKYQKYGALTIVFIFLSFGLLILLFFPILDLFLKGNFFMVVDSFFSATVIEAILWSFLCSFTSTALALMLGIPLAYLLVKHEFPGKKIIDSIIDLPLLIPHSVAGIMLYFTFASNTGELGKFLGIFGIQFLDQPWGIVIAMFFVSSPILIRGMKDAFHKIEPNYEKAARTLGASKTRSFFDIHMQMSLHDMLSNSILCWARGLSEFGAVYIIASSPTTAAVLAYNTISLSMGLDVMRSVSIVLILISIMIFISLRIIESKTKRKDGGGFR